MSLSLKVEIFDILGVVNRFRVDLIIANNDSLPDLLLHLFEVDVEVLFVLDIPEAVIDLDTLVQLTIYKSRFLAFNLDLQMLILDSAEN